MVESVKVIKSKFDRKDLRCRKMFEYQIQTNLTEVENRNLIEKFSDAGK